MTRGILKKGIVSFTIKPSTTVSQTADIAQLGYIGAGGARKLINHIGLVAGTTKVRFYNDWYKATIITTSSLPLNNVTLVKIRETFATLSSGNTTAEFEIFFDDKQVAYLKTGPKSKQVRTDDLYFAAPPKYVFFTFISNIECVEGIWLVLVTLFYQRLKLDQSRSE